MASITGNGAKGHHKFTLTVTESYVSGGADNYSNVDYTFKISPIQKTWDWSSWGNSISYVITINGNKYTGSIPAYDGSSTVTLKSGSNIKIPHNTDGSKTISYSFTVTDGAGKSYTCGNASATGNMTLTKIPRYGTSTQSLSSKTETSITMSWSSDSIVDYLWYSVNNGTNWTGVDVTDAKSGTYTVNGLSPASNINVKTRIRRKDSQLTTDSTSLAVTLYDYPHITKVGISNLIIGYAQTLELYNPLSREVTIKMLKDSSSGTQLYSGTTKTTSITFTPTASTLYNSIPNSKNAKAVYTSTYSTSTISTTGAYTYSIDEVHCVPTFNNFTYKDINTTVTNVTGNNQILVKGLSNLQVTVSSANKMVTKNSASPSKYIATIDTLNKSVDYNTSDINLTVGTVVNSGTKRLTVTAYDSRTMSKAVYKDITVYDYAKPVINATAKRLNNFEAETTLKVSGTYTRLTINNADKNTVTSVQYRYRETGGTWSNWTNLTTSVTSGKFTCTDVVLSLDNTKAFEFEVKAVDKLQTNGSSVNVDIGQAIFMIGSNTRACYINGQMIRLGYGEPAVLVNGDYNTMCGLQSGFFKSTSTTNAPRIQGGQDASNNWFYIVQVAHSENFKLQIASPFFESDLYFRNCINGTWGKWKRLSFTEIS